MNAKVAKAAKNRITSHGDTETQRKCVEVRPGPLGGPSNRDERRKHKLTCEMTFAFPALVAVRVRPALPAAGRCASERTPSGR
jgi:hypothetical protein